MITIGLVTWTNHPSLAPDKKKITLSDYAAHFPVVEIDSLFYGLRGSGMVANWLTQVPKQFQFIIKAHQAMTTHRDFHEVADTLPALFMRFKETIQPLVAAQQLKAVLMQFPPFFRMNTTNLNYLRQAAQLLAPLPMAVEFRNASWYDSTYWPQVRQFMRELQIIHVIPDEPQSATNTVPSVYEATSKQLTIMRLHGRNAEGWQTPGERWRKTRNLYRYSDAELHEIAQHALALTKQSQEVCIIFNNNSAGDAAPNALQLQKMLGLHFDDLAPQQLDLF